jgi:plastocyanin
MNFLSKRHTARPKCALRLLAAVLLALPMIPLSSATAAAQTTRVHVVWSDNGQLEPSSVSIPTGGSVSWTNDSDYTVTLSTSTWGSHSLQPDGYWSYTFQSAGTYTYTATSRSENGGTTTRTGTVVVGGSGAPPPSPSPTPPPTPSPTRTPPPSPTPPPPTPTPTTPPTPPPPTPTTPPPPPPTPSPTATPAPSTTNVSIGDDFFQPKTITVSLGSTVTWTDNGSQHTVTCTGTCGPQSFDSGNLNTGATFSHTFTVAGTYNYICVYHAPGMSGTITVQ